MSTPSPPVASGTSAGRSKRAREDDSVPDSVSRHAKRSREYDEPRQRDKEFWFEDGSVILVARDFDFRVYKQVLSDHSVVFADMFSLPQHALTENAPTTQACPIVHLSDSPEDLRHIFRALFPRKDTTFLPLQAQTPSFNVISAYARLGHKYQLDGLLAQSLAWLKRYYTTSIDAWHEQITFPFDGEAESAISTVNIARLTQCHTLLPTAIMTCCGLEAEYLMSGVEREDGTMEKLNENDIIRCITKKCDLMRVTATAVLSAFAPFDTVDCKDSDRCQLGIRDLLHLYMANPILVANEHPFDTWGCYADGYLSRVAMCNKCIQHLRQRLRAEQVRIWNQLPEILDLGTIEGWPISGQDGKAA